MTEPISTAIGAGIAACLMSTLGIEPSPIFWAVFGGCVGMSAAAEAGKLRALAVFGAAAMCCALFGTWFSATFYSGNGLIRDSSACVMAMFFHPVLNAAVPKIPQAIDAAFKRLGIT